MPFLTRLNPVNGDDISNQAHTKKKAKFLHSPASQPASKLASQPASKLASKPASQQFSKSATEPASQPVTNPLSIC